MRTVLAVLALCLLLAAPALAGDKEVLEEAKAAKGAMCTLNGAIVVPLKKGTGPTPTATSTVKVHYTGTLSDGKVFDSSVKRGTPAEFPLDRVIPCWTEGMQRIAAGGKAKLVCPPKTGYGDRGVPGVIPPNSVLTFEVELISIVR